MAHFTANGKTRTFAPAENVTDANARLPLAYFDVKRPRSRQAQRHLHRRRDLRFSGAQRLAVLAYGKSTHLAVEGDWPSPGFDGGFLPVKTHRHSARFYRGVVNPFIARGIPAEGTTTAVSALDRTALGVRSSK